MKDFTVGNKQKPCGYVPGFWAVSARFIDLNQDSLPHHLTIWLAITRTDKGIWISIFWAVLILTEIWK